MPGSGGSAGAGSRAWARGWWSRPSRTSAVPWPPRRPGAAARPSSGRGPPAHRPAAPPGRHGDPVTACDREHVCMCSFLQPSAQRPVLPVDLIAGDPGERHPRGDGTLDHVPRQLRPVANVTSRASRRPGSGRGRRPRTLAVTARGRSARPAPGRISEEDADLRVLDPPSGAGYCRCNPGVRCPS